MSVKVHATGVAVRVATDAEVQSIARAHRGDFVLTPPRSSDFTRPAGPLANDEIYVVTQAFVELTTADGPQRFGSTEHHGHSLSLRDDATLDLLKLARDAAEDLIDLLADMRIAKLDVTRWELLSAPHRIELEPGLEARLAPLRPG